mgnify:FL=1
MGPRILWKGLEALECFVMLIAIGIALVGILKG